MCTVYQARLSSHARCQCAETWSTKWKRTVHAPASLSPSQLAKRSARPERLRERLLDPGVRSSAPSSDGLALISAASRPFSISSTSFWKCVLVTSVSPMSCSLRMETTL